MKKPLAYVEPNAFQIVTESTPSDPYQLPSGTRIGDAEFDASGLTQPRTITLPDKSGTVAYLDDLQKAIGSTITANNTVMSATVINIIAPSAAITVLFPASPAVGTKVDIRFINAATYNVTQNGNGSNLRGFNDVYVATGNYYMTWQYFGTVAGVNIGWDIVALGRQ